MRDISATLKAAQKQSSVSPLAKVVLTMAEEDTQTFSTERILDLRHSEEPYSQTAEVLLQNSDGALTSLNLRGYQGVISYGITTGEGDEYSACAPLWVIAQQLFSAQGQLLCRLSLAGILNLIGEDSANADLILEDDDSNTVKDLLQKICGDSGVSLLDCFDHCTAYDLVFDSEDSLIDSFQPKDSFKIMYGQNRLGKIKELIQYTKCVMRAEDDGKIHIFEPTTSGDSYNYEYSLAAGSHTFFDKTLRQRLVIPNYIIVKSHPSHEDQYSGSAEDTDSSDLIEKRDYVYLRLASDDQADNIAAAILAHHQWEAERGHGFVPMNVGAEVHDYVLITDTREDDNRSGNKGYLLKHYRPGWFRLEFRFGKVFPGGLAGTMPPGGGGGAGGDLSDLWDFLNQIWALLQEILAWINAYRCPYEGYIRIGPLEDIILTPGYDTGASAQRWIILAGQIAALKDMDFGLLLATAAGVLNWYTADGTYEHVFCPDTDAHGKLGASAKKWLEGHIKKAYHDTRLKIPVGTDMYD